MTPSPHGGDDSPVDATSDAPADATNDAPADATSDTTADATSDTATARGRATPSRRTFLKAAGGTAAAVALAGCNGTGTREAEAAPAVLVGTTGYSLSASRTLTATVERSDGETTTEVTVRNALRAYEGSGTPTEWVATLTTPVVEVDGGSVALLAGDPLAEVLRTDGAPVLAETALRDDVSWRVGPAAVARFEGRLLGASVKAETVVGATAGDEVVVAHVARTHNQGDVVLVASVRAYPAPEPLPDAPADLPGAGEVPGDGAITDQQAGFVDVLEAVGHPAGDASTPTVAAGDVDPRAVVSGVTREPMGGGRDRITAIHTRFDPEEGLVHQRVRFDDLGFRQRLIDRAPDRSADVTSDVPLPSRPTDSPDGLLGRVRRTVGAARAAIGSDGWTADRRATGGADGPTTGRADGSATGRADGSATGRADGSATGTKDGPTTGRADGSATGRADRRATGRADGPATGGAGWSGALSSTTLPEKVSLKSEQTPLKNQGGRGTCVSFCACSAMEAAYKRAGYGELDLSEQYLNHLQKTAFIHTAGSDQRDPATGVLTNDGFENFLGTGGGSALGYMLPLLTEYGVPRQQDAQYQPSSFGDPYYVYDRDYENNNQQGDTHEAYKWNDPSSTSQAVVDGFNLQDEMSTYRIAPDRTDFDIVPFPRSALREAHYGIDSYVYVDAGGSDGWAVETPEWFESLLAAGYEVMIGYATGETKLAEPRPEREDYDDDAAYRQAIQQWKDDDGDVQVYDSSGSGGGHCICLVGYDRTGPRNHFVAKDNYDNYSKMGYDLFENGVIGEAGYIRSVRDPAPGEFHPQDFLGRYDVAYDGGSGTLDVRRLPHFFDPGKLPGGSDPPTADRRVGSFVDEDGTLYRVNGEVVRRGPSPIEEYTSFAELHWNVDFDDPNQPYDSTSGTTFVGLLNVADTSFMGGWVLDGRGLPSEGFHAARQSFGEGTAGVHPNSAEALLGEWTIHSPFHTDGATLVVDGVDSLQDSFAARVRNRSSPPERSDYADPVTGSFHYPAGIVDVELDANHLGPGGTPGSFYGLLHADSPSLVSGAYTYQPSGAQAPMVLVREDVEPFVEIVSPADGATVVGGTRSKKTTTLEAFVVGPPGATVRWRATDRSTGHTTIVGEGERIGAALAPGTYTIEARYAGTAPPEAKSTDTITVTVESS